ncbi:hypothetical protein KNP414_06836 [Paenibacillus mucilaginosus KNP414]|uniref:Uncharacterized protein n=1 Tax=Paenibacillus mucilaginosus (strain KNP414) TaxID=1036673 RepID=F8FEN8_PAEMK|nr:hypothetical protein KNP414_06836 [Paenibacillus mucilaginosus KNP414]
MGSREAVSVSRASGLRGRQFRNGRAIMKSNAGFTKLMTQPTISYMVTNR